MTHDAAKFAEVLGFSVHEASFNTGEIVLIRGDETFKFPSRRATRLRGKSLPSGKARAELSATAEAGPVSSSGY
jgi:hypothetical protein